MILVKLSCSFNAFATMVILADWNSEYGAQNAELDKHDRKRHERGAIKSAGAK